MQELSTFFSFLLRLLGGQFRRSSLCKQQVKVIIYMFINTNNGGVLKLGVNKETYLLPGNSFWTPLISLIPTTILTSRIN